MAAYYETYALEKERYPLLSREPDAFCFKILFNIIIAIFRGQPNEHICRLYQELGCEYHLIQEDPHFAPIIPSLTPVGFAYWMAIFLLAYPEEEWRRLEKVVLEMPIDFDGALVNGKPERLPKQISRHLLPKKEDCDVKMLLEGAFLPLLQDPRVTTHSRTSIKSSPVRHYSSRPPHNPVEIHQVRNPLISLRQPPQE
jgi:hypothetical protein